MSTASNSTASGSVIAAAVVAIAGSVLTILCFCLTLLSVAFVGSGSRPQLPAPVKIGAEIMFGLFIAVAIFGVATGIGLIRLRNWARISALVWAGFSGFCCAFGLVFVVLIPFPAPPNAPAASMAMVRWILFSVYGLPVLVSVWWLVLFNRSTIKSQFRGENLSADGSAPQKPRCPLPLAVLAWLLIVSILNSLFVLVLPFHMPVFLFGRVVAGGAGKAIFLLSSLLFAVAGVGLLKLKPWSYPLAIGMYLFWIASGVVSMLTPNFRSALNAAISEMLIPMHLPDTQMPAATSMRSANLGMFLGLAFCALILGMLFYYRRRFLEAAAASSSLARESNSA